MRTLPSRFGCELQPDIEIDEIITNPLLTSLSSSASANVKGIEQTVKISQLKSNYFLTLGNKCYKTIVGGDLLVKLNTYFFGNVKLYKSDGYIEFPDGTQQTTAFVKSDIFDKIIEKINIEVINRINDVDQETFDRITAVEQEVIAITNDVNQETIDRQNAVNQEILDRTNAVNAIQSRITILATTLATTLARLDANESYINTLYEGFLGSYPDAIGQ